MYNTVVRNFKVQFFDKLRKESGSNLVAINWSCWQKKGAKISILLSQSLKSGLFFQLKIELRHERSIF